MATTNSKGQAFPACAAPILGGGDDEGAMPSKPLFSPYEPFSGALEGRRIPGSALLPFFSSVYRIAGGCQVLIEFLAQEASDDARRLSADPPAAPLLMDAFHRGQLHSLISASLQGLTRQAEQLVEWVEEHCEREG